jgi:hypothetical protein
MALYRFGSSSPGGGQSRPCSFSAACQVEFYGYYGRKTQGSEKRNNQIDIAARITFSGAG